MGPPAAEDNGNSNNRSSSSSSSSPSPNDNSDEVPVHLHTRNAAYRLWQDNMNRLWLDGARNQAYRSDRFPDNFTPRSSRRQTSRRVCLPPLPMAVANSRLAMRQRYSHIPLNRRYPYDPDSRYVADDDHGPWPFTPLNRATARKSTTQWPNNQVGSKMRPRGGPDDDTIKRPPPGGDSGS